MTDRKLFGTNLLVENFVSQLIKLENIDGGWSTKYVDDKTGQYWLKYVVDDRGLFNHLMFISPAPTTDELIDIAFTSKYSDEIVAAATRLCIEEQVEKKEYRQKVIDRLCQLNIKQLDSIEKAKIRTIIQAGQLTDRVNKRNIIGKHYTEIQKDADFFNEIANKAKNIFEML